MGAMVSFDENNNAVTSDMHTNVLQGHNEVCEVTNKGRWTQANVDEDTQVAGLTQGNERVTNLLLGLHGTSPGRIYILPNLEHSSVMISRTQCR